MRKLLRLLSEGGEGAEGQGNASWQRGWRGTAMTPSRECAVQR